VKQLLDHAEVELEHLDDALQAALEMGHKHVVDLLLKQKAKLE
jgi:hypothetical protein